MSAPSDGARADARKARAASVTSGAVERTVGLANLIVADTEEPMWSAVVIAKHILESDWFARVEDEARFVGKADAMANVLDPKGPIWTRMHGDGWDEGWDARTASAHVDGPNDRRTNPYRGVTS